MEHICILGTDDTDVVTAAGFQVDSGSVVLSGCSLNQSHMALSALVGVFTLFCPILHIAWIISTPASYTHRVQLAINRTQVTLCWIDCILHCSLKRNNQDLSGVSNNSIP